MPEDGKREEDGAGGKSIACGKILKPVHVKTRAPDLQEGSKTKRREAQR